jgi:spermidine/putrescine transport system permease protein
MPLFGLIPLTCFLLAFFYAPLLIIAYYSLYDRSHGILTINNYIEALTNPVYLSVILYSAQVAMLTTIITLLAAFPIAIYLMIYAGSLERSVLLAVFITPFWIDFLLRAWAMRNMLYAVGIGEGYLAMMLGMVYDFLPYMLVPLYLSLSRLSKNQIDAARSLGASTSMIMRDLIVPYAIPGITAGMILVFFMSLSEFIIPSLLGGVQGFTMGSLIYNLILAGDRWEVGSAIALMVSAIVMVLTLLIVFKYRGKVMLF